MTRRKILVAFSVSTYFILVVVNIVTILYQRQVVYQLELLDARGIYEDDPYLPTLPGQIQEVAMTFQENHHFSLVDDDRWAHFFPDQRGYVRLGPKGRSFVLALYHQFHCLNGLRFEYTVASDGLETDPDVLKSKVVHGNHCFQFIRQSILCRADDALIPVSGTNGSFVHAAFGVTHRCNNWQHISRSLDDYNKKWQGVPYLEER